MHLKELKIEGFKSFNKPTSLKFNSAITGIVGPNGSGKSNVTEAFRFVLGEQSLKIMRGKRGEDLIFNGGTALPRANRASVTIVFDNEDATFPYSFNEVSISRSVFRDGANEYSINGSQVRQRDILELLASVNVGATGHHIISQGESDRILNVGLEERKEIIEDGLGLKLLQYKKQESIKKLKKTQANIDQADLLLREVTPHLRYLKTRVDRYDSVKVLKENLKNLYAEYLAYEIHYISTQEKELESHHVKLQEEINVLDKKIKNEKEDSLIQKTIDEFNYKSKENRIELQKIREHKSEIEHSLGRAEGEYEALKNSRERFNDSTITKSDLSKSYETARAALNISIGRIDHKIILETLLTELQKLLNSGESNSVVMEGKEKRSEKRIETIKEKLTEVKNKENKLLEAQIALQKNQELKIREAQESERELLSLITKKNEKEYELSTIKFKKTTLENERIDFKQEYAEGAVLLGQAIDDYKGVPISETTDTSRDAQKDRRKTLERKKMELETMGADSGEEVYKEYNELKERIEFIQREKEDLFKSMNDCQISIQELQKEVDSRFNEGLKKISSEFDGFFKILFGGGKASVVLEKKTIKKEEDEEPEIHLGVGVQLIVPHKKIHTLNQLSGGERALVSIALLFAISQVTPPPFLILDETDAALDEANSRRYGDMIEELAKRSQLILVTHNRETMLRAGVLYGVTMSTSGASTLLSVSFEDAEKIAK